MTKYQEEKASIKSSHRHIHVPIASYHNNDSLLFQFILSEFLTFCHEMQNLQASFIKLKEAILKPCTEILRQNIFKKFISCIENLSGASHDAMRLFSWGQEGGVLQKLNSYNALFSRRSPSKGRPEYFLYRSINQCLLLSIQLHDLALYFAQAHMTHGISDDENKIDEQWINFLDEISQLEEKVLSHSTHYSNLLIKMIQNFSEDENVIFFVLRHSKEFDQYFYSGYVKELLSKISCGSLKDLEKKLISKYSKRGFSQLVPIISEKFERL